MKSRSYLIMETKDAIALLNHESFPFAGRQRWADLGCGTGLFTTALAHLLHPGSEIYAIDNNLSALKKISSFNDVNIKSLQMDFVTEDPPFHELDGILMANSLHFVKDKQAFIHKAGGYLKPAGCFLIVEYDTDKPVKTWVPYPVSFESLGKIFAAAGYPSILKLNEHPSLYNNNKMYAAMITR